MIVSVGDLVSDIRIVLDGVLEPDDDSPAAITIGGGGQAANFCAWAVALGERARLVARVGDDDAGHRLVADLEGRGVEVSAVWTTAEPTGTIAVLVDSAGRRTMATQRGASVGLSPNEAARLQSKETTFNPCRSSKGRRCLPMNPPPPVTRTDRASITNLLLFILAMISNRNVDVQKLTKDRTRLPKSRHQTNQQLPQLQSFGYVLLSNCSGRSCLRVGGSKR